jgi:hypothetical protein
VSTSLTRSTLHGLLLLSTIALLLTGCGEPLVGIPGGQLGGTEQSPPKRWKTVPDTIQVEFRPNTDPYSINIWGAAIGPDLYIATKPEGTKWSAMVDSNPKVRARIGAILYPLQAIAVTDKEERQRVFARYLEKYEMEVEADWVNSAPIFRLDRR